jgi:hypothetical protein
MPPVLFIVAKHVRPNGSNLRSGSSPRYRFGSMRANVGDSLAAWHLQREGEVVPSRRTQPQNVLVEPAFLP